MNAWIQSSIRKVVEGDAVSVLAELPRKCIDVIITDPVWWGYKVGLRGEDRPESLFRDVAEHMAGVSRRLIIILGGLVDPRPLFYIPAYMPFLRAAWLRYPVPGYAGPILDGADVAYVFGEGFLPGNKIRVMAGENTATGINGNSEEIKSAGGHPCPRSLSHMKFLVRTYTRPDSIVLDPFCGSGTTLQACEESGRSRWIGIDIDPKWVGVSRRRMKLVEKDFYSKPAFL